MSFDQPPLSDAQKPIYEMAQRGLSTTEIAAELDTTESVISAQITRIRRKRELTHPTYAGQDPPPLRMERPEPKPNPYSMGVDPAYEDKSNLKEPTPEKVIQEAANAGAAEYDIPEALRRAGERAAEGATVHPMVLLGITIQFVKLCGGRMHAHQVVEDVYEALRTMTSDGSPPTEGATSPWPRDLEAENAELKDSMIALQQELADLRRSFQQGQMAESH